MEWGIRPEPVLHRGLATHPAQWSLTASATHWERPQFSQTLAEKKLMDSGNSTKATNAPRNIAFDFVSPFLGISPGVYLDMCTMRVQIGYSLLDGLKRKQPKRQGWRKILR